MLGLDPEQMAAAEPEGGAESAGEIPLWPENVPAIALFGRLCTQLRVAAGLGGVAVIGLDYGPAPAIAAALGYDLDLRLWDDLRTCEAVALGRWNRPR